MKIAIFDNLPQGGAKRVVTEQIKYLSKNHKVKHFTFNTILKGNRLIKDFNNFITLNQKHKQLASIIDRQKFDVVIVHPDQLTQAPFILKYLKTPTIYFCQELLRIVYEKELDFNLKVNIFKKTYEISTRHIRKFIDKQNAKEATVIVTASKYIKKKVRSAYGINTIQCSLGVDNNVFKNYKTKQKAQLLFIGEPNDINGFDFAKQVAQKTNLNLEVIYGWKLSDKQLAIKYSESLVTLCVSCNEPFGLVPLEVAACKGVCLAVDEGGYKETIINKKTGYLLPRKVDLFVDKIRLLKRNSTLREKIGRNALEYVVKNYNWKSHGQCLEKIINQLIQK